MLITKTGAMKPSAHCCDVMTIYVAVLFTLPSLASSLIVTLAPGLLVAAAVAREALVDGVGSRGGRGVRGSPSCSSRVMESHSCGFREGDSDAANSAEATETPGSAGP